MTLEENQLTLKVGLNSHLLGMAADNSHTILLTLCLHVKSIEDGFGYYWISNDTVVTWEFGELL